MDRAAWPLLGAFVLLGFFDMLTTSIAYSAVRGFIEFNTFGADLFKMGFFGFMVADFVKVLPIVPLGYIVALRTSGGSTDNQFRLLKLAAFVVLLIADIFLGVIVMVINVPNLLGIVA